MKVKITMKHLQAIVTDLNIATNNPTEEWAGPGQANVGNFHISQAYDAYALHQMTNTGGGIHSHINYTTKRELYTGIRHILAGINLK